MTESNIDDLQGAAPEGFDSVHGDAQKGGALNFDELVVYKEEAVLPYAIIEYQFTKHWLSPIAIKRRMTRLGIEC